MQTGTIKRLTDRGFGFIGVDGSTSEKDLFFHSNELVGVTFEELKEGDKLQFEVTAGPKGDNATKVSRATGAAAADEKAEVAEEAEAAEPTAKVADEEADEEVAEETDEDAK